MGVFEGFLSVRTPTLRAPARPRARSRSVPGGLLPEFGRLCGQPHGGQDLFDGVLGLDQGDEAQRAFAARADRVDRERSSEQLAP